MDWQRAQTTAAEIGEPSSAAATFRSASHFELIAMTPFQLLGGTLFWLVM